MSGDARQDFVKFLREVVNAWAAARRRDREGVDEQPSAQTKEPVAAAPSQIALSTDGAPVVLEIGVRAVRRWRCSER